MEKLLQILHSWNNWREPKLKPGFRREVTEKIIANLHSSDVIALIGARRSGKTTILYQLINHLEQEIDKNAILHVNFEEPYFASKLTIEFLDELYEFYRANIFPEGRAYLFFDEIQNIPDWEKWVRARNENENVKIFITGSSAKLLSRELATLLTGRHLSFFISPLNFREILTFKDVATTDLNSLKVVSPKIKNLLLNYLKWGGFPRIILEDNDEIKHELLKQYFDDIIFKDIIMRHQIRDAKLLRELAVYLITNTASLTSSKRLANIFGVSQTIISSYQNYLEEGFVIGSLPIFSLKQAERNRNPKKNYCLDLGLRAAVNNSNSPDNGKVVETAIYNNLQARYGEEVYYWKGRGEVDFFTRKSFKADTAYQVTYFIPDEKTLQREVGALLEIAERFPDLKLKLLVAELQEDLLLPNNIVAVPLWQFLLEG